MCKSEKNKGSASIIQPHINKVPILLNLGALQANSSPRILELARPKRLADGYQESKNVIWKVLAGAKNAVASGRYVGSFMHICSYAYSPIRLKVTVMNAYGTTH